MKKFVTLFLSLVISKAIIAQCGLTATVSGTNITCYNYNNGVGAVTYTGATGTVSILWQPSLSTSTIAINLTPGVHTVTLSDANNCSATQTLNITQPPALNVVSSSTTPATCGNNNGTATVTIGGGTSPYSYLWNAPGNSTTNTASNLPAGQYTLTTTDSHSCTITTTINIIAPVSPSVSVSSSSITCFGMSNGSATLSPMGVGPFSYSWNPGGFTTPIVNGLGPAVFNATVIDWYGCTVTTSVVIMSPNLVILNVTPTQTLCNGSLANVYGQAAGGTPPFSYTLTNINTGVSTSSAAIPGGIVANETLTTTTQYSVKVVDMNGCTTPPQTILVNVTPKLLASGTLSCVGSDPVIILSANITSPGNGGPFSFNWSNGVSTPTNSINTNTISGATIFTLIVSDGCTIPNAIAQYTVDICTGMDEFEKSQSGFSIYPNPFNHSITLTNNGNGRVEYVICNLIGQTIITGTLTQQNEVLDLHDLEESIYLLKLSTGDQNYCYKLVKSN